MYPYNMCFLCQEGWELLKGGVQRHSLVSLGSASELKLQQEEGGVPFLDLFS